MSWAICNYAKTMSWAICNYAKISCPFLPSLKRIKWSWCWWPTCSRSSSLRMDFFVLAPAGFCTTSPTSSSKIPRTSRPPSTWSEFACAKTKTCRLRWRPPLLCKWCFLVRRNVINHVQCIRPTDVTIATEKMARTEHSVLYLIMH